MSFTQTLPIKAVVVGDGAVGKTCLLYCYTQGCFLTEYMPTVFDNFSANVMVGKQVVSLNLYDTAGQEDYDRLRPLAYPQTDVFVLLFSTISRSSYENVLHKWHPEVSHHVPDAPMVVCCTKCDLRDDPTVLQRLAQRGETPVTREEGEELAKKIGAYGYAECSSMQMRGVTEVFDKAIEAGIKHLHYGKGWLNADSKKKSTGKSKQCLIL
jgi:small GTP-binding protein